MQLLQYNLYQYNFIYNQKFKSKNELKFNKLCVSSYNKSCLLYPEDIIYLFNLFRFLFDQKSIILLTKKNISEFNMKAKNIIGVKITKRKQGIFSLMDSTIILYNNNTAIKNSFKKNNFKNTKVISLGMSDVSYLEGIEKVFNKLVYMIGVNINLELHNIINSYIKISMLKSIIKIL